MEQVKNSPSKKEVSRRDFIKKSALATAAFYIVPRHVLGGKGYIAPSDTLYIAGIGAGGKGGDDIFRFSQSEYAVISHLCDVDDRQAEKTREKFPDAPYYHDWRELFDEESKNFDAVSVGIPDHNHAVVALSAMQLGKHVYVQKPLTHDIYEARVLTEAAKKYKVVTQMGDQGTSGDGLRTLKEWYEAGLIGDIQEVYCWTDRPVWPQGIPWPDKHPKPPKKLKWDLWLGTAEEVDYIENLVPFNWRGWWRFGTGALGDMGCHIIGPPFKLFNLGYPTEVTCSASTFYDGIFSEAHYPECAPAASSIRFKYQLEDGRDLYLYWMDGGITPERPEELDPDVNMNMALADTEDGDYLGGTLFVGSSGKMSCGWGGTKPRLLPLSLNDDVNISQKYPRIPGGMDGHYSQWVEACLEGYENAEVDSPFEGYAGPLTESVLMGNLAVISFNYREPAPEGEGFTYPGRYITLKWDGENMKITNFEPANRYIEREYREGWGKLML